MKLLLIAYEFPPISSAQSIRWYYLASELRDLGFDIDVLTVDLAVGDASALPTPEGITVHRTFAGPFVGSASALNKRVGANRSAPESPAQSARIPFSERAYRKVRAMLDQLLFPDARLEWYPFALAYLGKRLRHEPYDCIIASHEPAVDLMIASRFGRRRCLPLVADMGDPIVTTYSPAWRRRFDLAMEGRILGSFGTIVTTNTLASVELARRHGLQASRLREVPQGTSLDIQQAPSTACLAILERMRDQFTLLYTGNFYSSFRNPAAIMEAISATESIRLLVVGSQQLVGEGMRNIEHIPRLSHFDCLHLQRNCTMLLSLGNQQPEQTPGKLIEYLGACRPIVHVYQHRDAGVELLESSRRGVAIANHADTIRRALEDFRDRFEAGTLDSQFDLGAGVAQAHAWPRLGRDYAEIIGSTKPGGRDDRSIRESKHAQ